MSSVCVIAECLTKVRTFGNLWAALIIPCHYFCLDLPPHISTKNRNDIDLFDTPDHFRGDKNALIQGRLQATGCIISVWIKGDHRLVAIDVELDRKSTRLNS